MAEKWRENRERGCPSCLRDGVLQKRRSGGERGRRSPPKSLSLLHRRFRVDDFKEGLESCLGLHPRAYAGNLFAGRLRFRLCPRAPKHARLDARDARRAARNDGRTVPTVELCPGPPRSVCWLLSFKKGRTHHPLPHRAGIYRSGHPNKGNFPFLDSLNLKTIM